MTDISKIKPGDGAKLPVAGVERIHSDGSIQLCFPSGTSFYVEPSDILEHIPAPRELRSDATLRAAVENYLRIRRDFHDFDGDRRGIAHALCEAENDLSRAVGQGDIHDLDG